MPYIVVSKSNKTIKKKKSFRILSFYIVLLLILSIIVALNLYWRSAVPTLIEIANARVTAQTLLVVNQAVLQVVDSDANFERLLNIERDANGDIVLLTSNTAQVNRLARQTAIISQKQIEQLAKEQIEIPFGTISGIPLFSEIGPDVVITVTPIGAVNCTFTSTFESVGINQTLYRIYIEVSCQMDLVIPTSHHTINQQIPILIGESVIVGNVPTTYLQGGLVLGSYSEVG